MDHSERDFCLFLYYFRFIWLIFFLFVLRWYKRSYASTIFFTPENGIFLSCLTLIICFSLLYMLQDLEKARFSRNLGIRFHWDSNPLCRLGLFGCLPKVRHSLHLSYWCPYFWHLMHLKDIV